MISAVEGVEAELVARGRGPQAARRLRILGASEGVVNGLEESTLTMKSISSEPLTMTSDRQLQRSVLSEPEALPSSRTVDSSRRLSSKPEPRAQPSASIISCGEIFACASKRRSSKPNPREWLGDSNSTNVADVGRHTDVALTGASTYPSTSIGRCVGLRANDFESGDSSGAWSDLKIDTFQASCTMDGALIDPNCGDLVAADVFASSKTDSCHTASVVAHGNCSNVPKNDHDVDAVVVRQTTTPDLPHPEDFLSPSDYENLLELGDGFLL
eukprot:TRINITY_DN47992_c0_g1_i1.p1 TRINITY_DN47992_c0_g1~~TRINITY_DN47992_c0_g1_i1.p1  ORF type:complete len:287 (-),score=24.86 TRINITY_DN47992_c0_g1_i1:374-1186(-)